MRQRGFTVIELLVVIIIISILASIATVQLMRTQPVARDKARAHDMTTISQTFDDVYQNGQLDEVVIPSGNVSVTTAVPMGYPSTSIINLTTDPQTTAILGNIDQRALKSPRAPGAAAGPNFSLVAATTNTGISGLTAGGVTLSATNDVYVYQPLDSNGALCQFATGLVSTGTGVSATTSVTGVATQKVIAPRLNNNCVRFNLYYYSEANNDLKVLASTKRNTNGL